MYVGPLVPSTLRMSVKKTEANKAVREWAEKQTMSTSGRMVRFRRVSNNSECFSQSVEAVKHLIRLCVCVYVCIIESMDIQVQYTIVYLLYIYTSNLCII